MDDGSFWVIERYINNSIFYWSAGARGECSRDDYTPSIAAATKFFDSDSAIQVLVHFCRGDGRVIEHQFISPASHYQKGEDRDE